MQYYLISGEASGDLHGASLVRELKAIDPKARFRAWGGDLMEKEGVQLVKHYKTLAFMGFWEVLYNLPTILRNIKRCKKDILRTNPDVIIYIDYPGFNLRIAKWAKKKGFKNHYYISPQVWAWKENRVHQMKRTLDALYVILPFEKDYFKSKHQFFTHFVGHPLLDQIQNTKGKDDFYTTNKLETQKPIIALLPGSRFQEVKKILPLFVQVAKHLEKYQFVVAAAPGISADQYAPFLQNTNIKILYSKTHALLKNSTAALITSGTATLEAALLGVPQLVCYKSSRLNYWIGKKIVQLKYISLVNLILDKAAVTELIQTACSTKNLIQHLHHLLQEENLKQLGEDYQALKKKLGGPGASKTTAELILKALKQA